MSQPEAQVLSFQELGTVLLKHFGKHEGFWDVTVEFQIAAGAIGPTPDLARPGIAVGVDKIGIRPATEVGPQSLNASELNPR